MWFLARKVKMTLQNADENIFSRALQVKKVRFYIGKTAKLVGVLFIEVAYHVILFSNQHTENVFRLQIENRRAAIGNCTAC